MKTKIIFAILLTTTLNAKISGAAETAGAGAKGLIGEISSLVQDFDSGKITEQQLETGALRLIEDSFVAKPEDVTEGGKARKAAKANTGRILLLQLIRTEGGRKRLQSLK